VDSGLHVQLEEDGDGSIRQSGVETSGLCSVLHWKRQGISKSFFSKKNLCTFCRFDVSSVLVSGYKTLAVQKVANCETSTTEVSDRMEKEIYTATRC